MDSKDSNPKDVIGSMKSPLSCVPMQVVAEAGLGMLEGAVKYGRFNYRIVGVRASVYYDALQRHMTAWWECGQDIDLDSGLHHVTKAISCLMVLRDAMINGKFTDDRPPSVAEFYPEFNRLAAEIIKRHERLKPVQYTIADKING